MRLCWEHIDPQFAAKVGAEFAQIRSEEASEPQATENLNTLNTLKTRKTSPQKAAVATIFDTSPASAMWSFLAMCISVLVVLLYLSVCFHLTGPLATFALTAVPLGLVTVGCWPEQAARESRPRRLRGRIPQGAQTVFAVARTTASDQTSRAERLYGDVLLLLLGNGEKARRHDTQLRHELLRQCNALLTDYHRIELHRRRLQTMLAQSEPLTAVEAEHTALLARADAETDPIARRSFEESAELCAERGQALRAFPALLNRLDAHNEVICQALSLARAALTRIQATPISLTPPDLTGLRAAVRRVSSETRAVEEAVTELTYLG